MASCEVIDTATLSLLIAIRRRYKEKHKSSDPKYSQKLSGMRYNKDVDCIPIKSWLEAKKMCESIRAGRRHRGPAGNRFYHLGIVTSL
jgi:hypothetical protein